MKTTLALALATALPLFAQPPPVPPTPPVPPAVPQPPVSLAPAVSDAVKQALHEALRSIDETDPFTGAAAQRIREAIERDVHRIVVAQAAPKTDATRTGSGQKAGSSGGSGGSGGGGGVSWSSTYPTSARFGMAQRGSPGVRTGRVLVVSAKSTDAKVMSEIEEDLNVMSRVFEKEVEREVGQDGPSSAMGIVILGAGDARSPNAIYLDGYGALFTLNVRFPLIAPAAKKEEPRTEKPADSLWDRTKREMFGPRDPAAVHEFMKGHIGEAVRTKASEPKFDAAKVEGLKKSLVEALKNASNLRHLKPEDFVTVVAQNAGSGTGDFAIHTAGMPGGAGGGGLGGSGGGGGIGGAGGGVFTAYEKNVVVVSDRSGGDSSRQATLTVRAKKSDIDEFAKGKLSAEEFRKKAQVNLQ